MTAEPDGVDRGPELQAHAAGHGPLEEHAQGEIRSYHGIVNKWLLAVYAILTVWAIYYLFKYWGGLGPGLAR